MIKIEFVYDGKFNGLDDKVRLAVAEKLTSLTRQLYDKVSDNLNGKVLQKQTGQLAGSIQETVNTGTDVMEGIVHPSLASPKAWALERGGSKSYDIYPVKASLLRWTSKSGQLRFAKHVVHPPSKEFAYLRLALEEMAEIVPEEFAEAIAGALE